MLIPEVSMDVHLNLVDLHIIMIQGQLVGITLLIVHVHTWEHPTTVLFHHMVEVTSVQVEVKAGQRLVIHQLSHRMDLITVTCIQQAMCKDTIQLVTVHLKKQAQHLY